MYDTAGLLVVCCGSGCLVFKCLKSSVVGPPLYHMTIKNMVLFYLHKFVVNDTPYSTNNVLVGNIHHLFCLEIFPDFLCFGIAWIWMIICDIIHNDISCLDVGLSFCVVKCAAAPLFTDQAAGQQELNGQQATQQCWVLCQCQEILVHRTGSLFIEVWTRLCSSNSL